jgi:hypothetical protein
MEIVEIISHYIDKNQNIINVEFKLLGDDEDIVREDIIEYSFFEEFGYDNKKSYDIFESFIDEDDEEWDFDDETEYIENEDTLISFLNEYYIVYPKKLPKGQMK